MADTPKRKPGRPPMFKQALSRREILVERDVDDDALRVAEKRGVSVSEVYREWIAAGRMVADKRGRK